MFYTNPQKPGDRNELLGVFSTGLYPVNRHYSCMSSRNDLFGKTLKQNYTFSFVRLRQHEYRKSGYATGLQDRTPLKIRGKILHFVEMLELRSIVGGSWHTMYREG